MFRCRILRRSSHSLTKLPASILKTFPPFRYPISWDTLTSQIQQNSSHSCGRRLIVLDDDPTGCQTIYNMNVLLKYDPDSLMKQLQLDHPIFYILTNSRAMNETEAVQVTNTILENLNEAKKRLNYLHSFQFISRGDSTLRGHYPAEVDAIAMATSAATTEAGGRGAGGSFINSHATILIPSFHEGGRVTINSCHFLTEGDELIPVGMTPFAADPHFGYRSPLSLSLSLSLSVCLSLSLSLLNISSLLRSSNLKQWVIEKTKGRIKEEQIHPLTLTDLRHGGPNLVSSRLSSLSPGDVMIVDTIEQMDLNVFVAGLLKVLPPPHLSFTSFPPPHLSPLSSAE
jgi:hypothetical protein